MTEPLTPEEEARMRAADAEWSESYVYTFPDGGDWPHPVNAVRDRRRLLAYLAATPTPDTLDAAWAEQARAMAASAARRASETPPTRIGRDLVVRMRLVDGVTDEEASDNLRPRLDHWRVQAHQYVYLVRLHFEDVFVDPDAPVMAEATPATRP